MRRRLEPFAAAVVVASAITAVAPTATSDAAAYSGELCFGRAPTIVGSPDQWRLSGTEGADVVLTNGSGEVDTLGGNDLVCITGRVLPVNGEDESAYLFTGAGRDRVDARRSATESYTTWLQEGSDEYIGGAARDFVAGSSPIDGDLSVDVIRTAGGEDFVSVNGADVADLGTGTDELRVNGVPSSGDVLRGGPGVDRLGFNLLAPVAPSEWVADNRSGRLLRDGRPVARWASFSRFGLAARGPITFIGAAIDESLELGGDRDEGPWIPHTWPIDVRMMGGDDTFGFYGGAGGSRFDGGTGVDRLLYDRTYSRSSAHVVFDLKRGVLRDILKDGRIERRAVAFEEAKVEHWRGLTTLKGTGGPNRLIAVWGRESTAYTDISGRGGNDVLVGGEGDDLLVGGGGHDVARGRSGLDRCEAEVRFGCEG